MKDTELDRAYNELDDVRRELNNPKIGLLASKKLYRRLSELYAIIDKLEVREYAG